MYIFQQCTSLIFLVHQMNCSVCVEHSGNLHSISWQTGFKFLLVTVPSDVIKWSVLFVFKHTNANFPAQCECTLTPTLLKCLRFFYKSYCAHIWILWLKHHCALPGSTTVKCLCAAVFKCCYVHVVWCMVWSEFGLRQEKVTLCAVGDMFIALLEPWLHWLLLGYYTVKRVFHPYIGIQCRS